jgi:hypothetical protein
MRHVAPQPQTPNRQQVGRVPVAMPGKSLAANVRAPPLEGFQPVVIGAMWCGRITSLIEAFLNEMQKRAKRLA